jgi:hypothetical protein
MMGREEDGQMATKGSVTVPLTMRQKQAIKRATGKTISALKVRPSGGLIATKKASPMMFAKKGHMSLAKRGGVTLAKRGGVTLAKRSGVTLAKRSGVTLAKRSGVTLARKNIF